MEEEEEAEKKKEEEEEVEEEEEEEGEVEEEEEGEEGKKKRRGRTNNQQHFVINNLIKASLSSDLFKWHFVLCTETVLPHSRRQNTAATHNSRMQMDNSLPTYTHY